MRASTALHMQRGDTITVDANDGSVWVQIGEDSRGGVPIFAADAEQFERLADECEKAAQRMRAQLVAVRTVGATIEAAG